MESAMNIRSNGEFDTEVKTMGNVWFCCASPRVPASPNFNLLARFINSPKALFIASMASWPVVFAMLAVCAGVDSPRLAFYLTTLIASIGLACAEMSVVDCGRSFYRQHPRLLAAFSCWAAMGLVTLRLFACLP